MSKFLWFIIFFSLTLNVNSQTAHQALRDGDEYYSREDFASAELAYRKAAKKESSLKADFNLGNSLYSQERFEEAIDAYQFAIQRATTPVATSEAYYNLGNAYFFHQDLEQAISAFKKAVLENPQNTDAQYNLIICKEILKQKQQQQHEKQCNNPQQSEDGEKGEEQEKSEEQQEQEQQENQEQEEPQDSEESEEEKQDSTSSMSEGEAFDSSRLEKQTLDSLDAAKLLQVIENEEQKVQERLKKFNSNVKKPDKDW